MAIVIVSTAGAFGALPEGIGGSSASSTEHRIRIVSDADGRSIAQSRITIDGGAIRYADSGGRLRIDRAILRPGTHTLTIAAPGHTAQDLTVLVPDVDTLDITVRLRRTAAVVVVPDAVPAVPIALTFGSYVPFGSPSPWAEIDPTSASVATVTSDQPSTDTARSISTGDYGSVCAILSGVSAGTAVEWEVAPSLSASGPKVLLQACGPSLILWFGYTGGAHATGTFSITATVGAVVYGPIVLTVA